MDNKGLDFGSPFVEDLDLLLGLLGLKELAGSLMFRNLMSMAVLGTWLHFNWGWIPLYFFHSQNVRPQIFIRNVSKNIEFLVNKIIFLK